MVAALSKELQLLLNIDYHERRENTGLQLCRTLDIQETLQEILQVVSFLVFCQKTHQ